MRRMRGGDQPREPATPQERIAAAHPGELVIATANRTLVRIGPNGEVTYPDGATPDEAARALWESVGRQRDQFERRTRYLTLLELHVALLFVTDQAYETAQNARKAAEGNAETTERYREELRQREELSRGELETRVHGIIEFAREFALLRPDLIETARRGRHQG